jgi:hypothetical protein
MQTCSECGAIAAPDEKLVHALGCPATPKDGLWDIFYNQNEPDPELNPEWDEEEEDDER